MEAGPRRQGPNQAPVGRCGACGGTGGRPIEQGGLRTSARDCRSCGGTGGRLRLAEPQCPWEALCETDPEGCACAVFAKTNGPVVLERAPEVIEVHRLQTSADISAGLHVWQAVVGAGAYADVAAARAGELLRGITPELAEEILYSLERLQEATTTALVVVRAELRDQLAPAQLQLELGGGVE